MIKNIKSEKNCFILSLVVAAMKITTEAALLKQIGECVEKLMNYENVPIIVGYKVGKYLRTMGSRHLRVKLENEFRKNRGWEKTFKEDKKDMMNLDDDEFYTSGMLDKEAERTGVRIFLKYHHQSGALS